MGMVPGLELFCGNVPVGFDMISLHSINSGTVDCSGNQVSSWSKITTLAANRISVEGATLCVGG